MKGAYCLIIELSTEAVIKTGSLGILTYLPGTYVYVGSARNGIEQRVGRHKGSKKMLRWHIDYLLTKGVVISTVALPCENGDIECRLADALSGCEGAERPFPGFGSSDCRCKSHLIFFGDSEPAWVGEEVNLCLANLDCIYPRSVEDPLVERSAKRARKSG